MPESELHALAQIFAFLGLEDESVTQPAFQGDRGIGRIVADPKGNAARVDQCQSVKDEIAIEFGRGVLSQDGSQA